MTSLVDIGLATEADIPALAHIGVMALQSDLISRVLFSGTNNTKKAQNALAATLHKELHNPKAVLIKATVKGTGEVVAYLYFFRNDLDDDTASAPLRSTTHDNLGSMLEYLVKRKQSDLLVGQRHWVGKQLMVLPAYQKRGIGRAIIDFALANVDLGGLPVYLNGSLSGTPLYQKMGWKVVDTVTVGDATADGPGSEGYLSRCMVAQFPSGRTQTSLHAKL